VNRLFPPCDGMMSSVGHPEWPALARLTSRVFGAAARAGPSLIVGSSRPVPLAADMAKQLTPRGRQRRDQLIDYATARFAERGYHDTSVADLVSGLGVGKGVFYWYFESKEELFVEILREAQLDLRRAQRAAIGAERDPVRRIERGIRSSLAWIDRHPHHNELIRAAAGDDRFRHHVRRGEEIALNDLSKHVKDAIVDRGLHDADPEMIAQAILGVVGRLAGTFLPGRGTPVDAVADAAVAFCLGGLLVEQSAG
jgi:AcrR family transcriptional regulator